MKRRIAFALALAVLVSWASALMSPNIVGLTLAMAFVGTTGPGAAPTSSPGDGVGAIEGNINEAMKILFEGPLTNSIVSDSEMLDIFQKDMNVKVNQTDGGRYIEMAHYFALPAGVGSRSLEDDYIPVPDGPRIRNSQVYLKKLEGTVQMSGDTMRRVKEGPGAFVTWAKRQLPDLKERVDHELDRQLIGAGTGIKARINEATPNGDANLIIDAALGLAGLSPAWLQFLEGERVVFGPDADGSTIRPVVGTGPSMRILDLDPENETLILDTTPANLVNSDYIFSGDDASNAAGEKEVMGLHGMVDDGTILATFQGLLRSDYRLWRSIIVDGSVSPWNGELSEELLVFADDKTYVQGKGDVDCLVMSRATSRDYWASLMPDRRLVDPRDYTGGKRRLYIVNGNKMLELKVVRKMPDGIVFGLQKNTFKHWRNSGWEWDDTTGAIWNRVTDATGRKDSFYATGCMVLQTGCIAPAKSYKITGITTTI